MKKILVSLIILGLILMFSIINVEKVNKVLGDENYIENYAKEQIKNFIYEKFQDIYNIKDISFIKESTDNSSQIFLVKIIHTLKLNKIYEHPII